MADLHPWALVRLDLLQQRANFVNAIEKLDAAVAAMERLMDSYHVPFAPRLEQPEPSGKGEG